MAKPKSKGCKGLPRESKGKGEKRDCFSSLPINQNPIKQLRALDVENILVGFTFKEDFERVLILRRICALVGRLVAVDKAMSRRTRPSVARAKVEGIRWKYAEKGNVAIGVYMDEAGMTVAMTKAVTMIKQEPDLGFAGGNERNKKQGNLMHLFCRQVMGYMACPGQD
nr:hypothetical protein Iba_chr11bCG11040 [Ipomoea batatas]